MDYIDYYKILGVTNTVGESDIKKKHIANWLENIAHVLSPNIKEPEKKFKEINETNEVLSDPVKRIKYDKYGKAWQHADEIERTNQARNQTRDGQRHSFGSGQFSGDFSEFF